jgi:CRISPR/Cas system-associated protein Csx1
MNHDNGWRKEELRKGYEQQTSAYCCELLSDEDFVHLIVTPGANRKASGEQGE